MGTGYVRQSAADIVTGQVVEAAPINAEFNQLRDAFHETSGHSHDGTTGEGPKIGLTTSVSGVLPVANGGYAGIHNVAATTAPVATNDSSGGYAVGSHWLDITNDKAYVCVDATATAAVWIYIGSAGSGAWQPLDTDLTAIAALISAADKGLQSTGSGTWALYDLTAAGKALLDDANAAAQLVTLGLTATAAELNYTSGVTSAIQTQLNAKQGLDATLTALAGLTTAADQVIYSTGADTFAMASLTTYARTLLDDATASAARTTLGLVIGTDVQAYDAQLADIAALAVTNGNFLVANGTNWTVQEGNQARTSLGLGTTNSPQFTGIELGHATDTTITRSSAGELAVEGDPVILRTSTHTLINKTIDANGTGNSITNLEVADFTAASIVTEAEGLNSSDNDTSIPTTAAVKDYVITTPGYPTGHLHGLTLSNNVTDATNDIDIATGTARDGTDAENMVLASALTKQLDAAWAVGTNVGGLDTGTIADTTYHVWLIKRSDTGVVDVLFSTSASAPTMPTGYDYKRRIGSIMRSGSAIRAFKQYGDYFLHNVPVLSFNSTNPGTAAVTRTPTVPLGIEVRALITGYLNDSATANTVYFSSLAVSDEISEVGGAFQLTQASGGRTSAPIDVWTNTSGQIRSRVNASSASTQIIGVTTGWIDNRGRV